VEDITGESLTGSDLHECCRGWADLAELGFIRAIRAAGE
jgi:hypothetical protein